MKKIDTNENGLFVFLSMEEIDEMMNNKMEALRKNKKRERWNENELLYRRQVIYEWIRRGYSRVRIQQELMSRWGCVKRSAQRYVTDALNALEEDNREFVEKTREIQRERIEGIIQKAMESNNYDAALRGLEQINKLDGLYSEKIAAEIKAEGFKFNFGTVENNSHEE